MNCGAIWGTLGVLLGVAEFEVEFFLRGVECDTQFSKGREIEDYFFSLFSLPGPVLQAFGTFRKHSPVGQ